MIVSFSALNKRIGTLCIWSLPVAFLRHRCLVQLHAHRTAGIFVFIIIFFFFWDDFFLVY